MIKTFVKIGFFCYRYSIAVKDAEKDLQSLQKKIENIKDVLQELKCFSHESNKTRLSVTDKLAISFKEYLKRLQELKTQPKSKKTHKVMN